MMKRSLALLLLSLSLCAAALSGCGGKQSDPVKTEEAWSGAISVDLSDSGVKVNGETAPTDPTATVYTANDIVYYEDGHDFTYGEGTGADAHSAAEADAHTVVHITQPGSYLLSGTLSAGQVAVDLGEEAEEDPDAVVTLILNGVDITCTVAPAVIFYNVYECGSADGETATKDVDTSAAGANVIVADGTDNTVNGSYVARIYKPESVVLSEDGTEVVEEKKLHKYDAAFYSKMSMNVNGGEEGTGLLRINAENEGLDSELHLTLNGGSVLIESGNDGINTNEDGVSVTTVNGGTLSITVTGETGEGDGIDSNGWLVINGGTVIAAACGSSMDSGIDSDKGIHINGGTVIASGHMLDRIEAGGQNYAVFQFAATRSGEEVLSLRSADGTEVMAYAPVNACSNLIFSSPDLTAGDYTLWSGETQLAAGAGGSGMGGFRPGDFGGGMPGGFEAPEGFDPGQMGGGMTPPEGFDPNQMPGGMTPPAGFDPNQMGGGMPGGMTPPAGFDPGQMGGGQLPLEPDENGVITAPEGTAVDPETGTVTLPDGGTVQFDAIGRPEGGPGGMGGFGGQTGGELSTVFTMAEGGNTFSGVMPASEAERVMLGEGTETYPVIIGGQEGA